MSRSRGSGQGTEDVETFCTVGEESSEKGCYESVRKDVADTSSCIEKSGKKRVAEVVR